MKYERSPAGKNEKFYYKEPSSTKIWFYSNKNK